MDVFQSVNEEVKPVGAGDKQEGDVSTQDICCFNSELTMEISLFL